MKKTIILIFGGVILTSCAGTDDSNVVEDNSFEADCTCDEVVKNDGKYYLSGLHNEGDRTTFGELFTGTCGTFNGANELLERAEYSNGFILSKQEWKEVDGELFQVLDMIYDNNKNKEGYILKLERTQGFLYPIEYREYKYRKDVSHYSMQNGYGKTVLSGDLGDGFFEAPCKLEGYDASPSSMYAFLTCIEKENLPKFFVKDYNSDKSYATDSKSNKKASSKNSTDDVVEKEVESNNDNAQKSTEYYKINDTDGYSNLRKTPSGEVIKKVYDKEQFEVIGEENNHKKVKLSDGTIGYIHSTRVVKK